MRFGNSNPLANIPLVVKNLLIINVIVFFAQDALPNIGFHITEYFSIFHWKSELFKPHQVLSYMFLHGDIGHLFFNMFALFMFGRVLEGVMGSKRFLSFYLISGIGAAIFTLITKEIQIQFLIPDLPPGSIKYAELHGLDLLNGGKGDVTFVENISFVKYLYLINTPMLGASGSIFGILVAFGYLFPNAQLMLLFPPMPIKGKYIAILALVTGILLDFSGNVAHWAHFGGMLTGFILLKIWNVKANSFKL